MAVSVEPRAESMSATEGQLSYESSAEVLERPLDQPHASGSALRRGNRGYSRGSAEGQKGRIQKPSLMLLIEVLAAARIPIREAAREDADTVERDLKDVVLS